MINVDSYIDLTCTDGTSLSTLISIQSHLSFELTNWKNWGKKQQPYNKLKLVAIGGL